MDPQTCYDLLIDALLDNDMEAAEQAAIDLLGWLNRGGFPPTNLHDSHLILKEDVDGFIYEDLIELLDL